MKNEKNTGYCMKCKKKQVMENPEQGKMKNGINCVKGVCNECGTKMFKIGKLEE